MFILPHNCAKIEAGNNFPLKRESIQIRHSAGICYLINFDRPNHFT